MKKNHSFRKFHWTSKTQDIVGKSAQDIDNREFKNYYILYRKMNKKKKQVLPTLAP